MSAVVVSFFVHLGGMGGLIFMSSRPKDKKMVPVKITVTETKVPPPVEVPPVIPPKPEPKPKKKDPPKTPPTQTPQKVEQQTPVEAIQGISPDAMVTDGKGLSAPVGNTLLKEDEGKRLKPEDVGKLQQDCSSDARLIRETVTTPKYTEAALDANLEGAFVVDIFVDAQGVVLEAELRKKVGFGMDERIIESVKSSKFVPRKNKVCGSIAGWAEIKFSLVIP